MHCCVITGSVDVTRHPSFHLRLHRCYLAWQILYLGREHLSKSPTMKAGIKNSLKR
nr:MAG TPA: hypothetical protein [Caudoviricetes sp.]